MSSNQDDGGHVLYTGEEAIEDGHQPKQITTAMAQESPTTPRQLTQGLEQDVDAIPQLNDEESTSPFPDVVVEGNAFPFPPSVKEHAQLDHPSSPSADDDTASIPDDTPSIRGSLLSSPGSRTPTFSSPKRTASPSSSLHRPFDRRFQSRMSSSSLLTTRAASPAFLSAHSRQSSLASFGPPSISEADENEAPWEVIRWNRLKKITAQAFSEVGKRKFGEPTCLAVTDQIVIGTSKGMILVFDHQQNHKAIIGAGTKAVESGAVTALAISADHTTLAAGHATGHIFTWEVSRPAKPFLHIPPIDNSQPQARRADGHVDGSTVLHVGFLGFRHTALVSADDRGMAFSHLATRGMGAVARIVKSARILGRYPELVSRTSKPLKKSSVLAFAPLPLGNIEHSTDSLGLVAMLTPYLLVIVSTTPVAQTQYKAARPKEVAAHSAMTAALAWFPAIKLKAKDSEISRVKLAYAWSNVLTMLEVHEVPPEEDADKTKPPDLQFLPRGRYQSEEAIVAIQWLSRSVLAVLTITQQLLILEDAAMNLTDSFDLLPKNIYHADLYSRQLHSIIETLDEEDASMHGVVADAFHMSFRTYKNRLFLLGCHDIWWGSLTNWADRLLAMMDVGNYIGAIRLATRYYLGHGERMTIGLPEDDSTRRTLVSEKLVEMMSASLKYAFGKNLQAGNQLVEKSQMVDLAEASIAASIAIDDEDFLFDEIFSWYDDHDQGSMFVDILEPYILEGRISSLPPPALKSLVDHFAVTHAPTKLEELICLLDTSSMDIDQVTTLCKRHNLFDAYIYVWNRSLNDFIGPLEELLNLIPSSVTANGSTGLIQQQNSTASKMFPYLSFTFTSRVYPTGLPMGEDIADLAKSQLYDFLFSGKGSSASRTKSGTNETLKSVTSYENLRAILTYDTPSFMSTMNEAFEDSFLNPDVDNVLNVNAFEDQPSVQKTPYNRRIIIHILLEVMSTGFETNDTIYLDMFIARNLPKYPQYLLLSGTAIEGIFARLCRYPEENMREDAQLSVEYLQSVYDASDLLPMVPLLREAQFFRVLKAVFRQEKQYGDLISTYFEDEEGQMDVFTTIKQVLKSGYSIEELEKEKVHNIVTDHAPDLLDISIRQTAETIDDVANHMHRLFLDHLADDGRAQFDYLRVLLESDDMTRAQKKRPAGMLEKYVQLMCQFSPEHVSHYVETMKESDLRLQEVLPVMERSGVIDAAVILEARSGQAKEAMARLVSHLNMLKATLQGLLTRAKNATDVVSANDAIEDLLTSIEKYAKVGIWLCQGQNKLLQKAKAVPKSPKRANQLKQPLSQAETLWLDLLVSLVAIARATSAQPQPYTKLPSTNEDDAITLSLRNVIQEVFTALLMATTTGRSSTEGTNDFAFLRILRAFLSYEAEVAPSLSELRNVISSIFTAYAHEESLLTLSNSMLDKDVFVHIDKVKQMRQQGWRPRGQICEICRKRVWGPAIGTKIWESWQKKEDLRSNRRKFHNEINASNESDLEGKGKAAAELVSDEVLDDTGSNITNTAEPDLSPIIVFSCRHVFHQTCLLMSQSNGDEADTELPVREQTSLACPACI